MTVVDADGGKLDKALGEVDKQYALGEKIGDTAAMTGDLQLKGTSSSRWASMTRRRSSSSVYSR
jgi:hypothetical protein